MSFQKRHARILDQVLVTQASHLKFIKGQHTFVAIGSESLEYEVELRKEMLRCMNLKLGSRCGFKLFKLHNHPTLIISSSIQIVVCFFSCFFPCYVGILFLT